MEVEIDALPVVSDMLQARENNAPLVHDEWADNVFLETFVEAEADIEVLKSEAEASVTRTFRTSRQSMAPIEGRGVVAEWDRRLELLTLTSSTQMPHMKRVSRSIYGHLPEHTEKYVASFKLIVWEGIRR